MKRAYIVVLTAFALILFASPVKADTQIFVPISGTSTVSTFVGYFTTDPFQAIQINVYDLDCTTYRGTYEFTSTGAEFALSTRDNTQLEPVALGSGGDGCYKYTMWQPYPVATTIDYALFIRSGGTWTTEIASTTRTRIISMIPNANATSTIATTTSVSVSYFISPSDLSSTTDSGGTVHILSRVSGADVGFFTPATELVASTSGVGTINYTVNLTSHGTYSLYSSIFVKDKDDFFGQVFDATTTDFIWVSDFATSIFGTSTPDCSTSISTCGIFGYLFYPNKQALSMYDTFLTLVQKKPPIGYFVLIKSAMSNINASSTGAIVGWSIPAGILATFFAPVEGAITGILGFFILVQFYKRFKDVDLKG